MQITSVVFFLLLFLVYCSLWLVNGIVKEEKKAITISNVVLLLASYVFVAYADFRFAIVLLCLSTSTYFFAKKRETAIVGVIVAIVALGFFKYTNFFAESFQKIVGNDFVMLKIFLPLGISFYSFSAIGYLMDVRRNKMDGKSFLRVALYLAYFPKITSGPIQNSHDFFAQIEKKRNVGWQSFSDGIQIFVFGLFKKMVLADRLSVFVNQVYETPLAFNGLTVLLGTLAYSLQIYFDFSGYSDMAIGISKIMGIELPRNFNLPYLAHNVTELWKRWHITLSTWLRDYVYISFGGNRKGTTRTYVNLILTMLIGGLWHGANWTYVIWGGLHGVALACHKAWMRFVKSDEKKHTCLGNVLAIAFTFLFTNFCWIFFRAESIDKAFLIIRCILSLRAGVFHPYAWFFVACIILVISSMLALAHSKEDGTIRKTNVSYVNGYYPLVNLNSFWGLVAFFVLCGLIICFAWTGGSPFIYGAY